jgi:hypothetical protein
MEFSFHYSGPKAPTKARGCMSCVAAVSGLCAHQPPHAEHVEGCGLCDAAKDGTCGAHGRGVVKAMDEEPRLPPHVRALLDAELESVPDSALVEVKVSVTSGLHVDFRGERTGAPAKSCDVQVRQLAE